MTDKEAMKLALKALELLTGAWQTFDALDYGDNAITALKERLADHAMRDVQRLGQEIEQEPVALPCCGYADASAVKWNSFNGVVQCHNCGQTYAPPQPEQEPLIGCVNHDCAKCKPLTEEQIVAKALHLSGLGTSPDVLQFARAIEAAHGIKENT